jgi:predicted nucleic-acid-binding protein
VIALDTNLVVRFIVLDDPDQAATVDRLFQDAIENHETCFISDPVLCELEWVLASLYRIPRSEILGTLQDMLAEELFEFEDRRIVRQALDAYQNGKADFSDYLIGAKGIARGARVVYTFDRNLRGRGGFIVLSSTR